MVFESNKPTFRDLLSPNHRSLNSPSPLPWLRDRRSRYARSELRLAQHSAMHVPYAACHITQLRRHLPTPWTHNEYRLSLFDRHHLNRCHQIGIVGNHHRRVEQSLPRIVQQMCPKIHVRTLLLKYMNFRDYRIANRFRGPSSFFLPTTSNRVLAHRQCLPTLNRMIPRWQPNLRRCLDGPVRDRQIGQRLPCALGEEPPHVHTYLGQRTQCLQVSVLPGGSSRIRYSRHACRKVPQPINSMPVRKEQLCKLDKVKPLEWRLPQRAIIEVEFVHIDAGAHEVLLPKKARAGPKSSP